MHCSYVNYSERRPFINGATASLLHEIPSTVLRLTAPRQFSLDFQLERQTQAIRYKCSACDDYRLVYIPNQVYRSRMTLRDVQNALEANPNQFPRFVLPDGGYIPGHAHVTEVGHLVRNFIDCGGLTGREEKVVLQTHVGDDTDHRLRSDRFAKILRLGRRVIPSADLDVDVEYDCCVVAQYPIADAKPDGEHLNLMLHRGRTQCRVRERRQDETTAAGCATSAACC
jgi:hypothetical protein